MKKLQNITVNINTKASRVALAKLIVYPLCYLRLVNEDQAIKLMMKIIKVEVKCDYPNRT